MTANIVPLYTASVLSIAVLAAFARHNRKTGWKKQPSSFSQMMRDFYCDLGVPAGTAQAESRQPEKPAAPVWTPVTEAESMEFSAQLINLRTSLANMGKAPAVESTPQIGQMVRG